MKSWQQDIQQAISKIRSPRQAGFGIVEIVACGNPALPALRALLFEREHSGLFQTRCRAVDALAALNAYDVLLEYLGKESTAENPEERLGDDAVINYAAWSAARTRDERVFTLLLRLAKRLSLHGVIGALGTFGRAEAIPTLVRALEEDSSRNVAEFMLKRLGAVSRPALIESSQRARPSHGHESKSSRRRRRSSLSLLAEIGLGAGDWPLLRPLMWDDDTKVVVLVCKLCLLHAPGERRDVVDRLPALSASADWMLREEIKGLLSIGMRSARTSS